MAANRKIGILDEPFTVIISKDDIEQAKTLMDGMKCAACHDTRFKVETITRTVMTLVAGGEELIIVDRGDEEIHITKVFACARCKNKLFSKKL